MTGHATRTPAQASERRSRYSLLRLDGYNRWEAAREIGVDPDRTGRNYERWHQAWQAGQITTWSARRETPLTAGERITRIEALAAGDTVVTLADLTPVAHPSLTGNTLRDAWTAVVTAIACRDQTPADDADHEGYADRATLAVLGLAHGRRDGGTR